LEAVQPVRHVRKVKMGKNAGTKVNFYAVLRNQQK
jgi:hypothetical protein